MKSISVVNPLLGNDLHDGSHQNRLKLFVFSPLNSEPRPEPSCSPSGEKGLKFGKRLWIRFASMWPEVIYALSEAFMKQKILDVAGLQLQVEEVSMVPTPTFKETMTYRCFGQSGMIVARYQKNGSDFFQFPDNQEKDIPSCDTLLAANLRHKLLRLGEIRKDIQTSYLTLANLSVDDIKTLPIQISFLPLNDSKAYRHGLFKIKALNVRAFRCPVKVKAPEVIHQIIWNCGLGGQNTQGFGLVTLGEKNDVSKTH
ncbi:MAG: CRISPR-associated endoribonuclease Cas6 [Akkermansia sp.]